MKKISEMSCACVDVKPIAIDWQAMNVSMDVDDSETYWEAWSAETCEACGELVVLQVGNGNCKHRDALEHVETLGTVNLRCAGHVPPFEGPMMNYWYPLCEKHDSLLHGLIRDEAVKLIEHLPLCLVRVDDEYGLALTGGGMDFSWEIAEAYMRLGFLPPAHFSLDRSVSSLKTVRSRNIARASMRSNSVLAGWAKSRRTALRSMLDDEKVKPIRKRKVG